MNKPLGLGLAGVVLVAGLAVVLFSRDSQPKKIASSRPVAAALASPSLAPAAPAVQPTPAVAVAVQDVTGSAWGGTLPAVFTEFRNWTARYLAASPSARRGLLAEGVELGKARRAVLAQLIQADPELALELAVPMVVRQQLPAEIVAQLEDRVSGRGNLALMGVTPLEGQTVDRAVFRTAVIGEQQYDAYVYGRRDAQRTLLTPTSIIGVALDGKLAVSASPLRVLESGELAAGRQVSTFCDVSGNTTATNINAPLNVAASTAVEYNGVVHVLCAASHVAELEAKLRSQERDNSKSAFLDADGNPDTSKDDGLITSDWSHGAKKVLIMRVDFSDKVGGSATVDAASATMNGVNGVSAYYASSSYGATSLVAAPSVAGVSPDITTLLRMPSTAASYVASSGYGTLMNDARTAATAAGYSLGSYDLVGVTFPSIGFGWSGLGYVGASGFWIQGGFSFYVVAHEIGHNYGLWHANRWRVTDGNPVSATGASVEYGDPFDVMGGGGSINSEFSQWNKYVLQWLPDTSITLGDTAGTYRVYRFDRVQTANLANPRALKVTRDATYDYWIGYRRSSGNASLNGGAYVIWGYKYNKGGELLDMTTPGNTPTDAGLAIGQLFLDSGSGITIKPIAQGGSGLDEYLDVQIGFTPRVSWAQTTFATDAQAGHILLTVSRTKSSVGAVSVNYATAPGTAVAPTDFTAQSGVLNWADGDMSDKTIDVVINPHVAAGLTKNFTVNLSGPTGGVVSGTAAATVGLLDAGVRDPSFLAYYISGRVQKVLPLPDGNMLIAGNFTLVYDPITGQSYSRAGVSRIAASGRIDGTYATGGGASGFSPAVVYDLARQPDGKVIAVGQFTGFNGSTGKNYIVRLMPDGSLDSSFNAGTGANGIIYSVLVQPDGKILIGGTFTTIAGTAREYLARLNANGSLDSTFVGPNFNGTSGGKVLSLALQSDGALIVGGSFGDATNTVLNLCRVTTTGAVDATFNGVTTGASAAVNKVVLQPNGRILLAGAFTSVNGTARGGLARLLTTGAVDTTFVPPAANGVGQTICLEPDGSLLFGAALAAPRRLAHFSSTGALDAAFSLAADSTSDVYDIALVSNGRGVFASNLINFQGAGSTVPVWQFASGLAGASGTVQFASATANGAQGTSVNLSVTRTGGSLGALTVGYSTVPSAAHFTPASGVLTWASGDATPKIITVPVTLGTLSGPESCIVNLGQPVLGGAPLGTIQQVVITISAPALGDLNGDGRSDILLTNSTTGERAIWLMNGTGVSASASLGMLSPNWTIRSAGDFNGDGRSDIILINTITGECGIWLMNGTAVGSSATLGVLPINWSISCVGDFNGDAKADIFLTNTVTGERGIWMMNGAAIASSASLGVLSTTWFISGTGDFNADGKSDLLLTNTATGERGVWLMNGAAVSASASLGIVSTNWFFSGIGDLNGDGKADVFLTNTATGERGIWLMNGTAVTASATLGVLPLNWFVSRMADYNGDGKADIFLTNTATGERGVWLMNGTVVTAAASLGVLPINWLIGN